MYLVETGLPFVRTSPCPTYPFRFSSLTYPSRSASALKRFIGASQGIPLDAIEAGYFPLIAILSLPSCRRVFMVILL